MPPTGVDLARSLGELNSLDQMIQHKQRELATIMGAELAISELRPILSRVLSPEIADELRDRKCALSSQAEAMMEQIDRLRHQRGEKLSSFFTMLAQI